MNDQYIVVLVQSLLSDGQRFHNSGKKRACLCERVRPQSPGYSTWSFICQVIESVMVQSCLSIS